MLREGILVLGAVAWLAPWGVMAEESRPPTSKADFVVASTGDNANAGTEAAPFATMGRAKDAIRQSKQFRLGEDILVLIRGGTYRLDETVVFSLEDSAGEEQRITYAAWPGETPVFSAGVPLVNWRKADPAGLPEQARGKVWAAKVPAGLGRFRTLYDGPQRLDRAEGPGFVPTISQADDPRLDLYHVYFPAGAMHNYPRLADAELKIVPAWPWTMNILPLESVDESGLVAKTAVRTTYSPIRVRFGHFPSGTVWVENVVEVLDEPGEWVLDSEAQRVYLWPHGQRPSDQIVAPKLTELLRVEGDIDYEGPEDTPVRNLTFRGLTFMHGDRFAWEKERTGWGLQHDWEMFDRPTAMVRLRGAEGCAVEACRFTAAGGTTIRLDLHCRNNRVADNTIEHVGGAGILLAGYGPGVKDVNKLNQVVNNHIHHVGELYWMSPGIFVWQSGENRVANNLIHHTPYTAIVVSGRIGWDRSGKSECSRTVRWHEIDRGAMGGYGIRTYPPSPGDAARERPSWQQRKPFLHARKNLVFRNEIHHGVEVMADGNGVYISGCGAGNVVRENYVHHCTSVNMGEGIRCDDDQHETLIDRNIVFRTGGIATGISSKGTNHITNNIIACPEAPSKRGMISLELAPLAGSIIERNILYATSTRHVAYHQRRLYGSGPEVHLRDCKADGNLYWNTADPEWGRRHLAAEREFGIEQHSVAADPMFVDAEGGDFRLQPDSPALKLGFKPIDTSSIGLAR